MNERMDKLENRFMALDMIGSRLSGPGIIAMMSWRIAMLLLVCFLLFWLTLPFSNLLEAASHQERPVTREQVLDVAKELVTPGGCPSLTLADCTLPTAFKIREEIAQMLAQGMEKEEIIDALVAKYGKAILGAPERAGWGLVIWYLPYTLMGFVAILLGFWLFRKTRTAKARSMTTLREDANDDEDIQEILKKYL